MIKNKVSKQNIYIPDVLDIESIDKTWKTALRELNYGPEHYEAVKMNAWLAYTNIVNHCNLKLQGLIK